jgi:hypothetical protein
VLAAGARDWLRQLLFRLSKPEVGREEPPVAGDAGISSVRSASEGGDGGGARRASGRTASVATPGAAVEGSDGGSEGDWVCID